MSQIHYFSSCWKMYCPQIHLCLNNYEMTGDHVPVWYAYQFVFIGGKITRIS